MLEEYVIYKNRRTGRSIFTMPTLGQTYDYVRYLKFSPITRKFDSGDQMNKSEIDISEWENMGLPKTFEAL